VTIRDVIRFPWPAVAMMVVALTIGLAAAKVKSRADYDHSFDFKGVQTWAWDASGPGDVKMARSADDDPEVVRRRIEPTLVAAVEKELADRGLKKAATGEPDIRVHYYALVTVGFATQTVGQFLPAVPEWGVPPYVPATSSFDIIQRGSIVLDVVSTRLARVVWRGIAESDIDEIKDDAEREALIRKAVGDLVRKLPKK
jgi:hypothetical protein